MASLEKLRQYEQLIQELREENAYLRTAALQFGELAERLNQQLVTEKARSAWFWGRNRRSGKVVERMRRHV